MPAVKHIVSGAVILLVIAAATYFFVHHSTTSSKDMACADSHLKIAAFGDSLVYGYGATEGNDFPSHLSTLLGVSVQNLGRNGDTTASALDRISQVVNARPDVVIVLLGGNDALQRVPVETTKANLAAIIETLQKAHIRVVLVGVMGGFTSDPYKPMFEDLAKTYQVKLVPNILSGIITNKSLMSDQVHPNDAGYAKVAAKLVPAIEAVCAAK